MASIGLSLLAAIAFVGIGMLYLFAPKVATQSFGLPLQ
jgi:hypothetical protein